MAAQTCARPDWKNALLLGRAEETLSAGVVVVPGLAHSVRGLFRRDGTNGFLTIPPNHESCKTRHESTCSEDETQHRDLSIPSSICSGLDAEGKKRDLGAGMGMKEALPKRQARELSRSAESER
jgi:hypothetical protein